MRATREQVVGFRKKLGLTQLRASKLLNTPYSTVQSWEISTGRNSSHLPPGIVLSHYLLLELLLSKGYSIDKLEKYLEEEIAKLNQ